MQSQEGGKKATKGKKEADSAMPNLLGAANEAPPVEEPAAEVPAPQPEPIGVEPDKKALIFTEELSAVFQMIEQVLAEHRTVAMNNGHNSIAIALGGIIAAARLAKKNIGSRAYWEKRVYK